MGSPAPLTELHPAPVGRQASNLHSLFSIITIDGLIGGDRFPRRLMGFKREAIADKFFFVSSSKKITSKVITLGMILWLDINQWFLIL
jgi:hypothetical protein